MNWRINTSLRLLGIPQRKKSAVTRMKGKSCPVGNRPWVLPWAKPSCFGDIGTVLIRFSFARLDLLQCAPWVLLASLRQSEGSLTLVVQPIHLNRCPAQDSFLLGRGQWTDQPTDSVEPFAIGRCKQANRPIGTYHHPPWTKRGKGNLDVFGPRRMM